MSLPMNTANSSQLVLDIRLQFKEKLRRYVDGLPFLDQSENLSKEPWILRAAGGFGDVYEAYLFVNGNKIKIALKQMRSSLCSDADFAKVRRGTAFTRSPSNRFFSLSPER